MTALTTTNQVVEHLIDRFGEWLNHRRDLSDIRRMDRLNVDDIARDLRVSRDTLDELVRKGPHAADELPKLLKALGIGESELARIQPSMLRDMQRVCALCEGKGQCDRDLAAGASPEHYREYCLNASTIEGLGQSVNR